MPTHILLKGATLWGLKGQFSPPEAGLESLKASGVSVLEIGDNVFTQELFSSINAHRFALILQTYPNAPEDLLPTLALAKETRARAINVHAASPHLSLADSISLVKGLIAHAGNAGIPLYFETHRGRITQDLYRTAELARQVPEMHFTLDVSHYVLCEERPGPTDRLAALLDPILDKVQMIHGRISNGQQIQVQMVDSEGEVAKSHHRLWAETMRRWRLRNKPGSSLIFTPELGPPPYAIVDTAGNELSSRTTESEKIWALAQSAWKKSATAGTVPCWP